MSYSFQTKFTPLDNQYLFLDMNSFFARCEQQLNPAWRNRPVVVAPHTGPTGCCIAVSSEAKRVGIRTGTGVGEARRIYPQVIVAPSRPHIYKEIHYKLVSIAKTFSPWVDVLSIDEMAIPLSPTEQKGEKAIYLAQAIKKSIKKNLGEYLTASIGIGPNTYLAKQAAESHKPNGLTILKIKDIPDFLKSKQLTDLTGIAYRGAAQLSRLGIDTPLKLYQASPQLLRKKLGIAGDYWYLRLHGYPFKETEKQTKSIGQSCVLPPEARNWATAHHVLQKLIERAGKRLRANKMMSQGVYVSIKFLGSPSYHGYLKTPPFSDSRYFLSYADTLWQKAPRSHQPFLVVVTALNLASQPWSQPTLFNQINNSEFSKHYKTEQIYKITDLINDRFGDWSLLPASLIGAKEYAPSRIPFGKVRY